MRKRRVLWMKRKISYPRAPGAVSGERGIIQTFSVIVGLIHHFGLDDSTVLSLLIEWNATCIPPWSESDLRHMVQSVRQIPRLACLI